MREETPFGRKPRPENRILSKKHFSAGGKTMERYTVRRLDLLSGQEPDEVGALFGILRLE